MSVNKGDKMTAAQINELIDKINHEAERRGYTKKVAKVTQGSPISFDTINAINLNRIEIAKIYRAGYENIKTCIQRTDKTGTPSKWDGRDLQNEILNEEEQPLRKGNKPYASQFNLLEEDINNLNAMCGCNSYKETRGCNCQSECTCDTDPQGEHVECQAEYLDCGGYQASIGCGVDNAIPSEWGCKCVRMSCTGNCDCVGTCSCNNDCTCEGTCSCMNYGDCPGDWSGGDICPSQSCICEGGDSVCGCDGD